MCLEHSARQTALPCTALPITPAWQENSDFPLLTPAVRSPGFSIRNLPHHMDPVLFQSAGN